MISQHSVLTSALFFVCSLVSTSGNAFLGHSDVYRHRHTDLLMELESSMGKEHREVAEVRISLLEAALRSKFAAMPKNPHGNIGHMAVRYLLHRVFVERHGWYVVDLQPAGDYWNTTSPTMFLEDRDNVPLELHGAFEKKLNSTGFNLHDVAVLAATLEGLIHSEVVGRLSKVYEVQEVPVHSGLTFQLMEELIHRFMVISVLGGNYESVDRESLDEAYDHIEAVYPSWPETKKFVSGVQQNVLSTIKTSRIEGQGPYHFDAVERVVAEIGESYGQWQNIECQELKQNLMDLEEGNSGRVLLEVFYQRALDGMWQFSERAEHLRQVGALDESNPYRPSVIIPNYVYSPSNCIAGSSFYDVCCIDECEALLGHLEDQIAAPDASPSLIARHVSNLASATIAAPQQLSYELLGRLQEIADHHHGTVPLHGRLFAQWLHHVYPRECPYPHLAGTTRPMTQEEWRDETGIEALATNDELQEHLDDLKTMTVNVDGNIDVESQCLPWIAEEELFVDAPQRRPDDLQHGWGVTLWLRRIACVAIVGSFSLMLVRTLFQGLEPVKMLSEKVVV